MPKHEPKLYSVYSGKVTSVKEFGAFVRLDSLDKEGLIHKSCLSETFIENVRDVLEVGEQVFCKIISLQDNKIGLSLKFVNQRTGDDDDKNNVKLSQSKERKREQPDRFVPISLGAVLNVNCTRCGGRGHLARDCFHQPGSEVFDLLPPLEQTTTSASSSLLEDDPSSRKRHRSRSGSSHSACKYASKKKRKEKKKKKEHKKKSKHRH